MSIRMANPVVRRTVDGGYSGTLTVTVGTGNDGVPPMLCVESDLLQSRLVLSMSEAGDLPRSQRLSTCSALDPRNDKNHPRHQGCRGWFSVSSKSRELQLAPL